MKDKYINLKFEIKDKISNKIQQINIDVTKDTINHIINSIHLFAESTSYKYEMYIVYDNKKLPLTKYYLAIIS